jgi:hypothetical protein
MSACRLSVWAHPGHSAGAGRDINPNKQAIVGERTRHSRPPIHSAESRFLAHRGLLSSIRGQATLRAGGAILRACRSNQGADLAGRCGERTLIVVRLMLCHFSDQEFEVVGHTLLRMLPGVRCRNERSSGYASFIYVQYNRSPLGSCLNRTGADLQHGYEHFRP